MLEIRKGSLMSIINHQNFSNKFVGVAVPGNTSTSTAVPDDRSPRRSSLDVDRVMHLGQSVQRLRHNAQAEQRLCTPTNGSRPLRAVGHVDLWWAAGAPTLGRHVEHSVDTGTAQHSHSGPPDQGWDG